MLVIGLAMVAVCIIGSMIWIDGQVKQMHRRSEQVDYDRGFEVFDAGTSKS